MQFYELYLMFAYFAFDVIRIFFNFVVDCFVLTFVVLNSGVLFVSGGTHVSDGRTNATNYNHPGKVHTGYISIHLFDISSLLA